MEPPTGAVGKSSSTSGEAPSLLPGERVRHRYYHGGMKTVTKRELNQNTAQVLAEVDDEGVIVTERGIPRWRVTAVQGHESVLSRLEREGRYTPPSVTPAPWPAHPGGPTYSDAEVEALLDEMRGDH